MDDPGLPWKTAAFTVVGRRDRPEAGGNESTIDFNYDGRTSCWRYTEWRDGTAEHYDHERDPHEYVNLADRLRHAALRYQLKQNLRGGWKAALPPALRQK